MQTIIATGSPDQTFALLLADLEISERLRMAKRRSRAFGRSFYRIFFTEVVTELLQTARNILYYGRLLATGICNTYLSLITWDSMNRFVNLVSFLYVWHLSTGNKDSGISQIYLIHLQHLHPIHTSHCIGPFLFFKSWLYILHASDA